MIKPELYHKTVGILFDSYFNDTLQHTNCYACAIGNIIAANCGYKFKSASGTRKYQDLYWDARPFNVYATPVGTLIENLDPDLWFNASNKHGITLKMAEEIYATGYSFDELMRIEEAFEGCRSSIDEESWMFNGLVAVLEVLKEIHQVTDEDLLTANNKRFKDHYEHRQMAKV